MGDVIAWEQRARNYSAVTAQRHSRRALFVVTALIMWIVQESALTAADNVADTFKTALRTVRIRRAG